MVRMSLFVVLASVFMISVHLVASRDGEVISDVEAASLLGGQSCDASRWDQNNCDAAGCNNNAYYTGAVTGTISGLPKGMKNCGGACGSGRAQIIQSCG